jgi:hypothetical protein
MDGLDKAIHSVFNRLALCQDNCRFPYSRGSIVCSSSSVASEARFAIWKCEASSLGRDAYIPSHYECRPSLAN